jgi:hypothetical protein
MSVWAAMVVTILLAVLHVKGDMLWSESKLLIRRNEQQLVTDQVPRERFPLAYRRLSKGAGGPAALSRIYGVLFMLTFAGMDALEGLEHLGLSISVSEYEPVVVFRLLIYFGSLTVLSAYPFTASSNIVPDVTAVLGLATLYGFSLYGFGVGWWEVAPATQRSLANIRLAALGCVAIQGIVIVVQDATTSGPDMVNIASALLKGKKREDLTQHQRERYRLMQSDAATQRRFRQLTASDWVNVGVWTFFWVTNGMVWGAYNRDGSETKALVATVLLEPIELVSAVLLLCNDTQVESELFRVLAQAEIR